MLGSGIYFADSSTLSSQFSKPGKAGSGNRLMLVNQVALGNVKVRETDRQTRELIFAFSFFKQEYTTHQKQLTTPPEGFDSVKGVKNTNEEPTDFKVFIHVNVLLGCYGD